MHTTIPLADLHITLQDITATILLIAHSDPEHQRAVQAALLLCVKQLTQATVAMEPWVDRANAQEGGAV